MFKSVQLESQKRGERQWDRAELEEKMTTNFAKIIKNINVQIQDAQWNPSRINTKETTQALTGQIAEGQD